MCIEQWRLHAPSGSMLDSEQSWAAGSNVADQWMQIDLGALKAVTGVITQGKENSNQWVTGYTVSTSVDNSTWTSVNGGERFGGNSDGSTKVRNEFAPVSARYVRFYTKSWHVYISMRAGVITETGIGARGLGAHWLKAREIVRVVYNSGTSGVSGDETVNRILTGLVPNQQYQVSVEILRNGLGGRSEYVKSVYVGSGSNSNFGENDLGEIHPDGSDYNCTWFAHQKSITVNATASGSAAISMTFTGHSHDCDCDTSTWSCSREFAVAGRIPMMAAARFTLRPGVRSSRFLFYLLPPDSSSCLLRPL